MNRKNIYAAKLTKKIKQNVVTNAGKKGNLKYREARG